MTEPASTITITHDALSAVSIMLNSCYEAFADQATSFSCTEIEMIADAYRAFGDGDTATSLIDCHSEGDDEGDDHFGHQLLLLACEQETKGLAAEAATLREQAAAWEKEL